MLLASQNLPSTRRVASSEPVQPPRYSLLLSTDADEIRASQRLRHDVFATELGARLPGARDGLDVDHFDQFCDHLLVREDRTGTIVGSYRMLPPERARAAGGLYTGTEFEIDNLAPLRPELVETGRSCVHADHRSGAVMGLMWSGILRYLTLTGNRWVVGCASVPMGTGPQAGVLVRGVREAVQGRHTSPVDYLVRPRRPVVVDGVPLSQLDLPPRTVLPPLLKGYLRLGAWVCGEPALDPDFGVADFVVLLDSQRIDPRYARRLGGAQT